jgi:hypothetical protein
MANTKLNGPLSNAQGFTIMSNHLGCAFISRLFFAGYPSAIVRFIVAIIVNSVNAVGWTRARAHVLKKCLERFSPPIANHYTSATIIVKAHATRKMASPSHSNPNSKFRVMRLAVYRSSFDSKFSFQTATAFSLSLFKRIRGRDGCIAAYAKAFPSRSVSLFFCETNYCKPPELAANKRLILAGVNFSLCYRHCRLFKACGI